LNPFKDARLAARCNGGDRFSEAPMDPLVRPTLDDAAVRAALRDVLDPELGENVVDLGLVEAITIEPGHVRVTLLPTSATCPMAEMLLEDAEQVLGRLGVRFGVEAVAVMDWEGEWDPQRLSADLRERFGW
jgi:metal-sulfur cluster biosynthetic enzyme